MQKQLTKRWVNGKIKDTRYQATIETLDVVNDLINDDKISYKGVLYRIDSVNSECLTSQEFSNRPSKRTTFVLIK